MNIFSIVGSIWRHKWAAIPVIVLTAIAMAYVSVGKPPSYSAKAYMLLENSPVVAEPTVNKDGGPPVGYNPVASLQNLTQVGDVLSQMVTTPAEEAKLTKKGAAPGYLVTPDNSLETPPILDITGVGSTPRQAISSTTLIANEIQVQLYQLQVSQNVNKPYLITSVEYVKPTIAAKASSSLQPAIVVLVAGLIVLLVAVSMSQSIQERRTLKRKSRLSSSSHASVAEGSAGSSSAADDSSGPVALDQVQYSAWPGKNGLAYNPNTEGSSS
jgi:uncharacterized protein involved in exopolysaccharide biosynthesis